MKLQIKCKICGYLCPSFQFLGLHLKKHKILSKDYYDTYMKEIGEGYCVVCGKKQNLKHLKLVIDYIVEIHVVQKIKIPKN